MRRSMMRSSDGWDGKRLGFGRPMGSGIQAWDVAWMMGFRFGYQSHGGRVRALSAVTGRIPGSVHEKDPNSDCILKVVVFT